MRAALIPPKGYERTALASDIHLVLPLKELVANDDYTRTYRDARERGDYVILDNGCAEDRLVDGHTLVRFAMQLGAHEIVAPDAMGCGPCTVSMTKRWLQEFPKAHSFNIMAVLQGRTQTDWQRALKEFAQIDEITTLGVPKIHVKGDGHDIRLRIVRAINNEYPGRFKIHLLGLNKAFPTEMIDVDFPDYVRSMDSAQPYKVTQEQRHLTRAVAWAKRRPDYFTEVIPLQMQLLTDNIRTFLRWAKGGKNEGGGTRS